MPTFHPAGSKSVQSISAGSSFRHLFWFEEESEGSTARLDSALSRVLPFYVAHGIETSFNQLPDIDGSYRKLQTFVVSTSHGEDAFSAFLVFSCGIGRLQRPLLEVADLVISEQVEVAGTTYKPVKMKRPTPIFNPQIRVLFDNTQPLFIF